MNLCKGKWNLCASPVDYIHIFAIYNATGEHGVDEVINDTVLMDIDLTVEQNYT